MDLISNLVIKHEVGILNLTEELVNISRICKIIDQRDISAATNINSRDHNFRDCVYEPLELTT